MSANSLSNTATGWCTFIVAGRQFGLDVARVQEVLKPQPMTSLPLAPPAVSGLLNLRGRIVPAVDLRVVLGLAGTESPPPGGHLVVFDAESPVSLTVDAIGDVRHAGDVSPVPVPHTLEGPARELISGAVPLPDGLLLLLDLDRTLERAFAGADPIPITGRAPRPAGGTS